MIFFKKKTITLFIKDDNHLSSEDIITIKRGQEEIKKRKFLTRDEVFNF